MYVLYVKLTHKNKNSYNCFYLSWPQAKINFRYVKYLQSCHLYLTIKPPKVNINLPNRINFKQQ